MTTDNAKPKSVTMGERKTCGYINAEPITDSTRALQLLAVDPHYERGVVRRLMPYGVLGPRPRGVPPGEDRYLPFIEHSWNDGTRPLQFGDAKDYLVSTQVADELVREGLVKETSLMIYEISLLGVAIYAARRMRQLGNESGIASASA